ncbi:hypothetical protein HWD03_gp091 [Alteromonas phage vB_AmeM_PT11-V22]|uniref:Uncharacterized protein n=1 Tax=Alteromonas phage vB_AmeM_PT11-V22 TaxID=2704031 RepID=A0A6C0R2Z5_9CAUD|nr:hypothetical protein HWD03_gp091 [Alteromonas phage vB_AmeM_PT11-V22]QHZ59772.1 hypothetical protein [Alteromonas phage vB_AmeM_PT11-V22]
MTFLLISIPTVFVLFFVVSYKIVSDYEKEKSVDEEIIRKLREETSQLLTIEEK